MPDAKLHSYKQKNTSRKNGIGKGGGSALFDTLNYAVINGNCAEQNPGNAPGVKKCSE